MIFSPYLYKYLRIIGQVSHIAAMSSAVRAAGFIIYRQMKAKTEYLLMQTSYGEHHWTPPKGHVDPGESDYETAVRETAEEAGIREEDMVIDKIFKVELK